MKRKKIIMLVIVMVFEIVFAGCAVNKQESGSVVSDSYSSAPESNETNSKNSDIGSNQDSVISEVNSDYNSQNENKSSESSKPSSSTKNVSSNTSNKSQSSSDTSASVSSAKVSSANSSGSLSSQISSKSGNVINYTTEVTENTHNNGHQSQYSNTETQTTTPNNENNSGEFVVEEPAVSEHEPQPEPNPEPTIITGSELEYLINSEFLNPTLTNFPDLDNKITEIFDSILADNMTNFQKVRTCYDYLVNNFEYGLVSIYIPFFYDDYEYKYDNDSEMLAVYDAYPALMENRGVCDNYSAAFVIMMRRLGFDACMVGGQVEMQGGGYTGHVWTKVKINGSWYIFDPQVESNNTASDGTINYYFFGVTYAQYTNMYNEVNIYETYNFDLV